MRKVDAVYDMNALIGSALWQCQALENTLVHYIVLKYRIKRGESPELAEAAFESVKKLTFGNLLADIRKQSDSPPSLVDRLVLLVKERNWLAHRCYSENQGALSSPKRLAALMNRCESIAQEALSLSKEFANLLENFVIVSGVSREELDAHAAKLIASWSEE